MIDRPTLRIMGTLVLIGVIAPVVFWIAHQWASMWWRLFASKECLSNVDSYSYAFSCMAANWMGVLSWIALMASAVGCLGFFLVSLVENGFYND